jgi:hypothetical protein
VQIAKQQQFHRFVTAATDRRIAFPGERVDLWTGRHYPEPLGDTGTPVIGGAHDILGAGLAASTGLSLAHFDSPDSALSKGRV